jgi:hypothetical protein
MSIPLVFSINCIVVKITQVIVVRNGEIWPAATVSKLIILQAGQTPTGRTNNRKIVTESCLEIAI